MQFKEILKALREERELSQKAIATACKLSPTCVCQLETGARNPTGSTLEALADFFEVSTDYLLGREDDFGIIQTKTPGEELTGEEKQLLQAFRKLNTKNRMHVVAYAEVRLEEQERGTRRA